MIVQINRLREISMSLLLRGGISNIDAEIVFNHLLDEELLGKHSHGFIRISAILNSIKEFDKTSVIKNEYPSDFALRIVADNTIGLVAAHRAAEQVIATAKNKGFAIVSSVGYKGTTGALGYYGRMIAQEGLIGIVSCTSEYAVAPWGGKEAILGTNPIAIAIPNGEKPIVSDFSTAAMTYGDLMLAVKEGREVPYGVVLDSEGKPSHNPDDANNGCQLPMAEHKGYALGLAVEILAGLFIGAKSGREAVKGSDGIIMVAIKPDLFISKEEYLINLGSLMKEIKSSSLAFGASEIRLPGENSVERIKVGRESGMCEVLDVVMQELIDLWEKI